jgi:hypothetical protein
MARRRAPSGCAGHGRRSPRQHQRYLSGGMVRMHAPRPWRARASGVLLHGTGTGAADELTRVDNHRPSIFWLHRQGLRGSWLSKTAGPWLDSMTRRSNGIRNTPMISIGRHCPVQGHTLFCTPGKATQSYWLPATRRQHTLPAYGAPRARTPCARYPVPHRPETALDGNAGIDSRNAMDSTPRVRRVEQHIFFPNNCKHGHRQSFERPVAEYR